MCNSDIERADSLPELNAILNRYLESDTITLYRLEIKRVPVHPHYEAKIDWEDNER